MKKLFIVFLMILGKQVFAQQDPLFSQYMFNKLLINPAYAGSKDYLSADILNRWQWVGISGAPNTLSASIHTPLQNPHIGLGLSVYNDALGPTVYQGALGTFAYRLIFPNSTLAFGLQAGIRYLHINWNEIDVIDPNDPLLRGQSSIKPVLDANFGIYYNTDNFYCGFSSQQLLQNQIATVQVNGKSEFTKLLRHFYGMTGATFELSDELLFRPSVLIKFVKNAPAQMDLNASFLIKKAFWLGVSYRTEKAVSFMTEINVSKHLRLGYSYDIWFNELQVFNKGSHEIRIGYDFDLIHSRMHTPRYF